MRIKILEGCLGSSIILINSIKKYFIEKNNFLLSCGFIVLGLLINASLVAEEAVKPFDFFFTSLQKTTNKEVFLDKNVLNQIKIIIEDGGFSPYLIWQKTLFIKKCLFNDLSAQFTSSDLIAILQQILFMDGYLNSKVTFDHVHSKLCVFFGNKNWIKNVIILNANIIPKSICRFFEIKRSKISLPLLLERKRKAILFLKKMGYFNCSIDIDIKLDKDFTDITYSAYILINLGHLAKFGPIQVDSNSKLDHAAVLQMFTFKEGDLWDSKQISQTKKKLQQTGIFNNVEILCAKKMERTQNQGAIKELLIPIDIKLSEDVRNEIKFSFGLTPLKTAGHFLGTGNLFNQQDEKKILDNIYFNNSISLSRYNLFTRYDRAQIMLGFDVEKKNLQMRHELGLLKNLSFENEATLILESSNAILKNRQHEYSLFGLANCLSKKVWPGIVGSLNVSLLAGNVYSKSLVEDKNRLRYLLFNPFCTIEKIIGNWFEEQGVSLSGSGGFLMDLTDKNEHIFFVKYFLVVLIPLIQSFSAISKIGALFSWSKFNNVDHVSILKHDFSDLLRTRARVETLDDLFYRVRRKPQIHQLIDDCLNPMRQNFYYSFEIRKLIFNNLGAVLFSHLILQNFNYVNISLGASMRYNVPVGTLYFNVGWNNSDNAVFWQFGLGEFSF